MTAEDRLNALINHFHTNIKAFATLCGYDRPQAFYDVVKGKTRNISPSMCDRILAAFPSVSRVWLLTGEGDMIIDKSKPLREEPESKVRRVPLVHIAASAGPLSSYYEEGEYLANCERILSPSAEAEIAVPICGDSMEPKIPHGSIAFIKKINDQSFIPWGHTLVMETENGVFIKNILPDENDTSYVWALSENPRYPKMHIPKASIYHIYRIVSLNLPFVTM